MNIIYLFLYISALLGVGIAGACQSSQEVTAANQSGGATIQLGTNSADQNKLTAAEEAAGWKLLFDGKTPSGWRGANKDAFPAQGWLIENGELVVLKADGQKGRQGGDIVTTGQYNNFELTLEAKLTPGANSGMKYFVTERKGSGSAIGLEFQLLDDDRHPDAKMGKNGNRTIGSLYDLIPADNKKAAAIGEWNKIRLLCQGNHVEHWLNGTKVVAYERGSPAFRKLVADSKYNKYNNFGEAGKGHLLLQDHSDEVHFRNIKIRAL